MGCEKEKRYRMEEVKGADDRVAKHFAFQSFGDKLD
jgi:hypothetical protein